METKPANPCQRVLLGTAVGDSLGLPAEGLSRRVIHKRWPGPWKQRLVFGKGMISDDTEHTVFVTQCLIKHPDDLHAFQKALAWKFRIWLLCVPAGIGFATLRAILKLWLGFPPNKAGVFSAGNGPAMRSAIMGAYFSRDLDKVAEFVKCSTTLTHTDPKSQTAALAIAYAAAWAAENGSAPGEVFFNQLRSIEPSDPDWNALIDRILASLKSDQSVDEFATSLGLEKGVSGYCYHTVPVCLYAWIQHFGDFRKTLEAVIRCGGDADTTGAIVGALASIRNLPPDEWVRDIAEWPISTYFLHNLGDQADQSRGLNGQEPLSFPTLGLPIRNLFFLLIVLIHGFRRLIPA